MTELVSFDYDLPGGGTVEVEATVTPGSRGYAPSLGRSGEPAEGPIIEIGDCYLKDPNDVGAPVVFDPDGLYVRGARGRFRSVVEDMEDILAMADATLDLVCKRRDRGMI